MAYKCPRRGEPVHRGTSRGAQMAADLVASLIFGVIVMIFPKILNYLIGIYPIIMALWALSHISPDEVHLVIN
jgi:hypothetical protein